MFAPIAALRDAKSVHGLLHHPEALPLLMAKLAISARAGYFQVEITGCGQASEKPAREDTMAKALSYEDLMKRGAPPKWWEPKIDRAVFKDLLKRNNYRAFLSHGLYFLILAAVGYLSAVLYTRGSPWCILAFFVYGTLFGMCNSRVHESLHGTPFKSVFWNEIVYYLTSAMEIRCALTTRWSHMIHHSYTIITGTDLEILAPRPAKMWKLLLDFFYLADGFISGDYVSCPKHNSRFHIPTGKAMRIPASVDLTTYPVKTEEGKIYIGLHS